MNSGVCFQKLLKEAELLHEKEDYIRSQVLLKRLIASVRTDACPNNAELQKIYILFGENILVLRDFVALNAFELELSKLGLSDQPEFELIRVWALGLQGFFKEAIFKADKFLESQGKQIHWLHSDFLKARGSFYSRAGNSEQALLDFEAAFSFFRVQKRVFEAGRTANRLGMNYNSLGNYKKAYEWYSRSEAIFDTLDRPKKKAILALNFGIIQYKLGAFSKSILLLEKTLKIGKKGSWVYSQCLANIALGNVYRMQREFDLAQSHLEEGLAQARSMSMAREESLALEFLGDVHRDQGRFTEALDSYSKTLDIIEPLAPEGDVVSETYRRIGECHILNGDIFLAKPHLKKALEMTRLQGDRFEEAVTLRVMAEADSASRKTTSAQGHIHNSCTILEELGANYELAIARFRYAEILLAGKDNIADDKPVIVLLNQAWHFAIDALNLFQTVEVTWWASQANSLVKRLTNLLLQQERLDKETAAKLIANKGEDFNPRSFILHNSFAMGQVLTECDMYAPDENPVLVCGETGTGKELIAHRLHEKSQRKGKLVTVNVAAISPTLFEREFFGHIKGAFSGADQSSIGFAEQAHQGTLFLDEIGELPLPLQPKLLRLLQNGSFHAVGDPVERSVDIRLVAATNVDLFEAVKNKTFREDLYYRLEVLTVSIPPLRDRPTDILPLMEHFLTRVVGRDVLISEYLNPTSQNLVLEYSWPGNVREIIAVCRKLFLQVKNIGAVNVVLGQNSEFVLTGPGYLEMQAEAGMMLESIDDPRKRLNAALRQSGGNRAEAARLLNVGRSTLYRQMKEFGL